MFGFGVDEIMVLMVDVKVFFENVFFIVLGEGGVFIVDMSKGKEDIMYFCNGFKCIIVGEVSYLLVKIFG